MTRLLGIVRRVLSWVAAIVLLLLIASAMAGYLAVSGSSLPILRAAAAQVGHLMTGQRTEQLTVNVRVTPDERHLSGTATLNVRNLQDGRQHFYFLLNNGLHVREVRVADSRGVFQPVPAYQLWLLTIVTLDAPVVKDAMVQLRLDYDGTPASPLGGSSSIILDARQIVLNVDAFWYPSDVQGFFTGDVTVTVPVGLEVVHNGAHASRSQRGDVQQVHWITERPVPGLALVAGDYTSTTTQADGSSYRLYLPANTTLDRQRVLDLMRDANHTFQERYGPSEFTQVTAFVDRRLRRAFNDGSGLLGVPLRQFRAGDYGFAILAHEIAHNWWGDRVAAQWLTPASGGEWIVEGFAEYSSLLATLAEYGPDALTRRLTGEFFDPARQTTIANMSVLDNALAEAQARDTIYRKGAYTALMLQHLAGDEPYFRALRQFLEQFRYQQVTDRDLQKTLQDVTGNDFDAYFAEWIRSDRVADLSLDANSQGDLTVSNLGNAAIAGEIDLWAFPKDGGEPARTRVHVGDRVPFGPQTDSVVLDPLLAWADVQRENNRYPRRNDPLYVTATAGGDVAVTSGEAFPWVRCTVAMSTGGKTQHTWDFDRGLNQPPVWSPDASRILVSYAEADRALPPIVTLAREGAKRTLGSGSAPVAGTDGAVYAATHDRIVRFAPDASQSTVVQRPGEALDLPLPSPDATQLLYAASRDNRLEVRTFGRDGHDDRLMLASDHDRVFYQWSADGTRFYLVLGGSWDWQVWEVPLAADGVRVLAREAAAITDLAVSTDGQQLAFTAAPTLDYPINRRQLYVVNLGTRDVRTIDVPNADLSYLAWTGPDSLLVIATAMPAGQPWIFPPARTVKRVRPSDGSVEDAP